MTARRSGAVRIASRPGPDDENPYFRQMYGALDRLEIHHAGAFQLNDDWLRAHAGEFDALHLHWPEWLWRPGGRSNVRTIIGLVRYLALARRLGLLRIWTVHNLVPHERHWPDVPGLWLVAREIDVFVCHSRDARRKVRRWLRPRATAQVVVMPLGNFDGAIPAPAPAPTLRASLGAATGTPLVGIFGQLRRYKGIETALDAIARLTPHVHLVIAGRPVGDVGWLIDRAAASRSAVTVIDRRLSDQELSNLISVLDVAWLPYTRITGSSALLLALTLGVPAVASDLPFFREVLEDAPSAGRLAKVGDPAALARATADLLSTPSHERRRAARSVADRYPWSSCIRPLAETISAALGDRRLLTPEFA